MRTEEALKFFCGTKTQRRRNSTCVLAVILYSSITILTRLDCWWWTFFTYNVNNRWFHDLISRHDVQRQIPILAHHFNVPTAVLLLSGIALAAETIPRMPRGFSVAWSVSQPVTFTITFSAMKFFVVSLLSRPYFLYANESFDYSVTLPDSLMIYQQTRSFGLAAKLKMVLWGHLPTGGVLEVDLPPPGFIRSARTREYRCRTLRSWQKTDVLATNRNGWTLLPLSSNRQRYEIDDCLEDNSEDY